MSNQEERAPDEQKTIELFNAHQENNGKRAEFLAKSVFLLSGGALTVSMGVFLGGNSPTPLTPELHPLLIMSWGHLLKSMTAFVLLIAIMILRDYIFAENWRRKIQGKTYIESLAPLYVADAIIWILGITGLIYTFKGFWGLSDVATALLVAIN